MNGAAIMSDQETVSAKLVAQSTDIHGDENFLQGCSFSPDGLCVLSSTVADSQLRLYNTPLISPPLLQEVGAESRDATESTHVLGWTAILSSNGGDAVRCYTWYPAMKSSDPASCCFLAAARDQPVHLYDAYTGDVRATYRPFNALDEMESPTVVEFSGDGQKILCAGFRTDRTIHIFETAIPGRESTILRLGKTRRSSDGQKGLVSAACFGGGASKHIFAVGTYAPGSIYVYDFRAGEQATGTILSGLCVVGHGRGHSRKKRRFVSIVSNKQDDDSDGDTKEDENWFSVAKVKWFHSRAQGGVTQLQFGPNDEYILYSASRRSNAIIAWDLRMLSGNLDHQSNAVRGLASYETKSDTNQRLEFDIDATGQTLYAGGQDNCVRLYDLSSGIFKGTIDGLDAVANGISHAYQNGRSLLAVATGSRRFLSEEDLDRDDTAPISTPEPSGYLRLYDLPRN